MAQELKNKPDYCCAAYNKMMRGWQIMTDTSAGTLHLRTEASAAYLPSEPAEQPKHYEYRRARAIFFNAVDLTLAGLVGMVFRNDPKLSQDVPEAIRGREATDTQAAVEGQWENIDNAGTHGAVFCKEVFTDAMRDGHAAILVDMPPKMEEGSTLADERNAGRRPYWVSYKAEQIINWRTKVVNGQTKLDLIVFKECSQEPDGEYGEKEVVRYRVLRPGSWEVYREFEEGKEKTLAFEGGGPTSLSEIPVAIVYSRKRGILMSQPPLLDLALTNIAHYQKYSDLSIYLHICSRPILWFRNRDTSKKREEISAYSAIDVADNGQVAFAETTGAALEAASSDIKDLETRMSVMGLSLLVKRTGGPITATEEKNDQIEESSDLSTAARSLQDSIELALRFHAQYLDANAITGGNVEMGDALDELTMTPQEMTFWSNAVAANQYSVETMWEVLKDKHPAGWTPEKERQRLDEDMKRKADLAEIAMRKFDSGDPDLEE